MVFRSLIRTFAAIFEKEIKEKKTTIRHMNIKLHTPKSLKTGSGMSSLKQFLLSLFATSVSIALTFGTAAIIDYYA